MARRACRLAGCRVVLVELLDVASANSPLNPIKSLPPPPESPGGKREHEVPQLFWPRDSLGPSVALHEKMRLPVVPDPPEPVTPEANREHIWPGAARPASFGELLGEGFLMAGGESPAAAPSTIDLMLEMVAMQQRQQARERMLLLADLAQNLIPPTVRPPRSDLAALQPIKPPPKPLPVYSLDEQMARGLEPLGKLFNREGLELRMMEPEHTPEAVLLKDPDARNRCQAMVLEQLARLGPLNKRELVRLTGLPEELLEAIVEPPNRLLGDAEVSRLASLRVSHATVLHEGEGRRLRLSDPEQQRDLRLTALTEIGGHVEKARQALQDGDAAGVVSALHPVHGYHQWTHRLTQPDLAFPGGAVELFEQRLSQEFGALARLDLAGLLRADDAALETALKSAATTPFEPGDPLEPLKLAVENEYRQAREFHDPRIPSSAQIAAERANRESELSTPESWAAYLESEFRLPHKILEQLPRAPEPGKVAEKLALDDLSPEVATPMRAYFKATMEGDEPARETALRGLLRLGPSRLLGKVELDGKVEPSLRVGRTSSSMGGGGRPLAENPHWVGMTRDAESVRAVLGITRDAQFSVRPLSQTETNVPFSHDLLLEDLLVARVMGRPNEGLQARALALVAQAEAGRYSHRWLSDPLGQDVSSGPIPAATGFGFRSIDDARKLGQKATAALAWARMNNRTLPLSPDDCRAALAARVIFQETQPLDSAGIDYEQLGQMALAGANDIEPEALNEILGVSGEGMRIRVQALQASDAPWLAKIEGDVPQALWRLLERIPKPMPDAAQGETFVRLLRLHEGDSFKAGLDFARVEQRVASGEDRVAVLQSLFGQATGVMPTATGGIAQLSAGLAVGGALLRTKRRSS